VRASVTLFIGMFTTLLAIINPLEALPIFLKLLEGRDDAAHHRVVRLACLYALLLMFFFLLFGTLILRVFGVPLSMVRIVGGIILVRIGFDLFSPSPSSGSIIPPAGGPAGKPDDGAFVPLAMPLMVGPGVIATILGMTSLVGLSELQIESFAAISAAIVATMVVTYLCLAYARNVFGWRRLLRVPGASRVRVGEVMSRRGGHRWATACRRALMLPSLQQGARIDGLSHSCKVLRNRAQNRTLFPTPLFVDHKMQGRHIDWFLLKMRPSGA